MGNNLKETLFEIADNMRMAEDKNDEMFVKGIVKGILNRIIKNNTIDWEIFYKEEKKIRRDCEKRVEIFIHVLRIFEEAKILSYLEDTVFVLVKEKEILKGFYLYGIELFPINEDDGRRLAEAYTELMKQKVECGKLSLFIK